MLDSLMLTLVWTFNVSALALSHRAELLKRVVLASWELVVVLVFAELAWSAWAFVTEQPPVVCAAACWLGLNLLLTCRIAAHDGPRLQPRQMVLLCSWWLALLAVMVHAVWLSGIWPCR